MLGPWTCNIEQSSVVKRTIAHLWVLITPKFGGPRPSFFYWSYSSDLPIKRYEHFRCRVNSSPTEAPWKRKIHRNAPYSTPPCTKFVGGKGPRYTKYFEGSFWLHNRCIAIVLRAYMWPPEGAQWGLYENLALPGGQISRYTPTVNDVSNRGRTCLLTL